MKTSGSGTKKTLLTTVAAQVESQTWWAGRLQEYLEKAPALLEKGPEVMKYMQELAGMVINFRRCASTAGHLPPGASSQSSLEIGSL